MALSKPKKKIKIGAVIILLLGRASIDLEEDIDCGISETVAKQFAQGSPILEIEQVSWSTPQTNVWLAMNTIADYLEGDAQNQSRSQIDEQLEEYSGTLATALGEL